MASASPSTKPRSSLAWCTQAPPQSNRNKTAETKGGAGATTQANARGVLRSCPRNKSSLLVARPWLPLLSRGRLQAPPVCPCGAEGNGPHHCGPYVAWLPDQGSNLGTLSSHSRSAKALGQLHGRA